jgi:sugar lactone lactonase YvrE
MTMKKLTALCILLAFLANGCVLDRKGMVFMIDKSYRPTIIGTTESGFTMPDGIVWRAGTFILADEGGHAVRAWKGPGDVKTLCDAKVGIGEPEDLAFDGDGNLFFTDDAVGGVWEIDNAGRAFELAGRKKGLFSTEGIVVSPSGAILVGDGERHEVFSVSRSGKVSIFLGRSYGITKPETMTYDERGNLYIGDNVDDVIYMLGPDMKLIRLIDRSDAISPEGILWAHHALYITDSKHGKLARYTPADGLQTIAVFAGQLKQVSGLTTDDNGTIFVTIQYYDDHRGYLIALEPDPRLSRLVASDAK